MKKITLLLVITFTFLFSTTSWGEWSFVVESKSGNKFYYDKDRIRKSGKYLYFWELLDYLKPTKRGEFSIITYTELDCSILRSRLLKYLSYNKSMGEGEGVMDFVSSDEWEYFPPNSSSEFIYNKICEEHQ